MRVSFVFLVFSFIVALCAADKTSFFTGTIPAGHTSVSIPYGPSTPGHGVVINSNANGSHALMTTLLPRSTFSVWNAASKTYEASWTATTCDMGIQQDINIIITCHTINSGSRCTSDVAYSLTVTEYNATLASWNPDKGALRWLVTLGGTGTSMIWNFTFDEEHSNVLSKRSDLHISMITSDGLPSSAAASLYSFSSKSRNNQACHLYDESPVCKSAFAGTSALFLGKADVKAERQYVLVLNGSEPRETFWIIAHATHGAKRSVNIWVFVAVAVACFVVGAILTGICTTFFWNHPREDKEPLLRS